MARRKADTLHCSFCNKSQKDVKMLIAASAVSICNECVDICIEIISNAAQRDAAYASTAEKGMKEGKL